MVRILANGDIVQDNDPRAQQSRRSQEGSNVHGIHSATNQNRGYGDQRQRGGGAWYGGGAGGEGAPVDEGPDGQVRQVSIFEVINQKLIDLGIPRWPIAGQVLEPIVIVGFLLALLLFGLPGLIFGALLFAVVKMS